MKTNDNIGVLFDTSFFIRLVNEDDPLFDNAFDYFEKFSQINFSCKISSIALAEYLVKGKMDDLPDNLSIVAFNRKHAVTAGDFYADGFNRKTKPRCKVSDAYNSP